MKTSYIGNLRDGDRVDDVFLICSKAFSMSQNGSQYARLRLADKTGQMEAVHWEINDAVYSGIATDDYVWVRGQVNRYKDKLQIVVDGIRRFNEKVDPSDFLPTCPKDLKAMRQELLGFVKSVEHPQLSALLNIFFEDKEFLETFCIAPAGAKIHHAYIGGLLEHITSTAGLCDVVCTRMPSINRDLLMTGAILHDIGKIEELSWTRSIKYSDNGQLLGHIVIGASMVERAIEKIPDFHPMLKTMLIHMILSHHGEFEYGSPKRPKIVEAIVLHFLEDMDAKVNAFQLAVGAIEEHEMWTERNWVFERPLFKGMPNSVLGELAKAATEEEKPNGGSEEDDPFDWGLFSAGPN